MFPLRGERFKENAPFALLSIFYFPKATQAKLVGYLKMRDYLHDPVMGERFKENAPFALLGIFYFPKATQASLLALGK